MGLSQWRSCCLQKCHAEADPAGRAGGFGHLFCMENLSVRVKGKGKTSEPRPEDVTRRGDLLASSGPCQLRHRIAGPHPRLDLFGPYPCQSLW